MRGDFTTSTEGKTVTSHILVDGQTSYLWMDGQKMGYKFTVEESDETGNDTNKAPAGSLDLEKKSDYSCKPWSTDSSLFSLPDDIEFSDMSNIMSPSGTQSPDSSKAAQCAACDSAPESARQQCKAALGCN